MLIIFEYAFEYVVTRAPSGCSAGRSGARDAAKVEASLTNGNIFIKLSKNGFIPEEDGADVPDPPKLDVVKMTNPIAFDSE